MNSDVTELVQQLIGRQCSRREVGRNRGLTLGFGAEVRSPLRLSEKIHSEWEIVTYYSAWRVVREGVLLCGSQDVVDSIDELNLALGRVDFGRLVSLRQFTDLDVRVEFDNRVAVDILATTSDDDECFHIRCPGKRFIRFSVSGGWKTGPSDMSWAKGV
jgi:hypothetical protein